MENTPAQGPATKDSAAHARSACPRNVIVDKSKRSCFAPTAQKKRRATWRMQLLRASLSLRLGWACLSVAIIVRETSTAGFTNVRKNATRKSCKHRIALDRLTSLRIVLAERHRLKRSLTRPESLARTQFRAAFAPAARCCPAVINVRRSAIRATAVTANKLSASSVGAVEPRQTQFATKARMSLLSA